MQWNNDGTEGADPGITLPGKAEQHRMHPDDFDAHLAWVMAKRFHEMVLKETFAEKPVYYSFIGQCLHVP